MIRTVLSVVVLCVLQLSQPANAQQAPLANWEKVLVIEAKLITNPAWDVKYLADSTIKKGLALAISQAVVAIAERIPEGVLKNTLVPDRIAELVLKSTTDYFQKTIKDPTSFDVIQIGIDIAAGAIVQGIAEVYVNDPIKAGLASAAVKGATVAYTGLTKGLGAAIAKEAILTAEVWVQAALVWNDMRKLHEETAEIERRTAELEKTLAESRKRQAGFNAVDNIDAAGNLDAIIRSIPRSGAIAYACPGVCGDTLTASGFAMRLNEPKEMIAYSFNNPPLTERGSKNQATVVDTGAAAGMYWGRWTGPGSAVTRPSGAQLAGVDVHYIYGPSVINMPTSGVVTYTPVGGTIPTSTDGSRTGDFRGGNIGVNFTTRSVSLNNLTFGFGGQTFVMNAQTTYTNTLRFFGSPAAHIPGNDVNCGNCPGATGGSYSGRFTGSSAQGIGLSYVIGNTVTGSFGGVQGFKK